MCLLDGPGHTKVSRAWQKDVPRTRLTNLSQSRQATSVTDEGRTGAIATNKTSDPVTDAAGALARKREEAPAEAGASHRLTFAQRLY